jgi:citronellol/citronellal dehydrogenase
MSAELKNDGISVNCLWPRTAVATAAIGMLMGEVGMKNSRVPEVMADAAVIILKSKQSGKFFIDDQVLLDSGMSVAQLNKYAVVSASQLAPDFFLDNVEEWLAELAAGRVPKSKL